MPSEPRGDDGTDAAAPQGAALPETESAAADIPAPAVGLYAGGFSDAELRSWDQQGQGFSHIHTYWGPSYPTAQAFAGFVSQLLAGLARETAGRVQLLVDTRAYRSLGTGSRVRVPHWGGFLDVTLEDLEPDLDATHALLDALAGDPNRALIAGWYVADESLARWQDVQAIRALAAGIRAHIQTRNHDLNTRVWANFGDIAALCGDNGAGVLGYRERPEERAPYNVNGSLSTNFGPRRFGIFGEAVEVVMINWFGGLGLPHWDGATGQTASSPLESTLRRVHLDFPGEKHLVTGYCHDESELSQIFERALNPVTPGYNYEISGLWVFAWYGWGEDCEAGYGSAWGMPGDPLDLQSLVFRTRMRPRP